MSEQLQLRRGTAASVASFTPAAGEVVVDTTYNRLTVGDGSTAGGWAAARAQRTTVTGTTYAALGTDRVVAVTALAAAATITLPSAASFPTGEQLLIVDETGLCSTSITITINAATSQTINGASSWALAFAYGFVVLESNGSNGWTVTNASAPQAITVYNQPLGVSATWAFSQRTSVTAFPVPSIRPAVANSVIALDIMPNGAPTGSSQNGVAWIDVCAQDCLTTNPSPLQSARVGISSSLVHFGSRGFNSTAALLPISFNFFLATTGTFQEAMRVNPSGSVTIGFPTPPADQGTPGLAVQGPNGVIGAYGSLSSLQIAEVLASGLSGASVSVSGAIPAGALVLAVGCRVTTAIAGATSFSVGYSGSASAFGSGVGVTLGTTNKGLATPTPFAASTAVVLTAAGGNFTAGAVRLSVHYLTFSPPTS